MPDDEQEVTFSPLSRLVIWNNYRLQVEIYQLDDSDGWILEVTNEAGSSIIWNDEFDSDETAEFEFQEMLASDKAADLVEGCDALPYPRPDEMEAQRVEAVARDSSPPSATLIDFAKALARKHARRDFEAARQKAREAAEKDRDGE